MHPHDRLKVMFQMSKAGATAGTYWKRTRNTTRCGTIAEPHSSRCRTVVHRMSRAASPRPPRRRRSRRPRAAVLRRAKLGSLRREGCDGLGVARNGTGLLCCSDEEFTAAMKRDLALTEQVRVFTTHTEPRTKLARTQPRTARPPCCSALSNPIRLRYAW